MTDPDMVKAGAKVVSAGSTAGVEPRPNPPQPRPVPAPESDGTQVFTENDPKDSPQLNEQMHQKKSGGLARE
jgi:hypothetical protein